MAKPEEVHFSGVWYALVVLAAIFTLPLPGAWGAHARTWAAFALGLFVGAEAASPGVKQDYAGTMTHWMYLRVRQNWLRALIGLWLAGLVWWRLDHWLGLAFLAWLPYHFSGNGPGPVDRVLTWLGARFGRRINTAP